MIRVCCVDVCVLTTCVLSLLDVHVTSAADAQDAVNRQREAATALGMHAPPFALCGKFDFNSIHNLISCRTAQRRNLPARRVHRLPRKGAEELEHRVQRCCRAIRPKRRFKMTAVDNGLVAHPFLFEPQLTKNMCSYTSGSPHTEQSPSFVNLLIHCVRNFVLGIGLMLIVHNVFPA